MKIAISAMCPSLDCEIDPRFGRSQYFVIVDPETMRYEILTNPNMGVSCGAGISTAQLVCNQGVEAVITGSIGPKAHQVLSAAGVRMLPGVRGRISDAIERFKAGKLVGETDPAVGREVHSSPGMGRGMGGGRGRGMGRGMGRGLGCGGGKGMGMGAGRIGAPGRRPLGDLDSESCPPQAGEPSSRDEIAFLKQRSKALAEELGNIQERIERMENK